MFVNLRNYGSLQEGAFVWKGEAYVSDIKNILVRFLGNRRTQRALNLFNKKYNISEGEEKADARLINFSEKLLTGSIGSASARILIGSVAKEKPVSLVEVLKILEESKETMASNKALKEQSNKLVELMDQLKLANNELREQDRIKDEFLDTVAHELKTPITSIKAASESLTDEETIPKELKNKFLDNISSDADRLVRLIHNILDFEKLAMGKAELEIQKHQLNQTINKAINGVSQIARKKGVHLTNVNGTLITASYDEDRLLQVLTNLLTNAVKFSDPDNGAITIAAKENKTTVQVVVEDNGKGIPEEDFNYVFDKFYQAKNQNIKKPEGSGLGLAISKKIIESHQGKIWIDRTYKQGARFIFSIPR